MKIPISLACCRYDHTAALRDGRVQGNGFDINYVVIDSPGEIFWRQLHHQEFDVSEMSLSAYMILQSRGDDSLVGIPIFPSRLFRHSFIFVNDNSGIVTPQDIRGKTVGVPEYHMTAAMFIRGMLADEYDVNPESIDWVQGGQEEPGRRERVELNLPEDVRVRHEPDRTLSDMLADGQIEALTTAMVPSSFIRSAPNVRRLFKNPRVAEQEYFNKTGVFPIMHLIVLKRELFDRQPWLAREVAKAFIQAKRVWINEALQFGRYAAGLPWYYLAVEETMALLGDDLLPYGVERNQPTLEAALRYSFEQGLSSRFLALEELFAENCYDSFVE